MKIVAAGIREQLAALESERARLSAALTAADGTCPAGLPADKKAQDSGETSDEDDTDEVKAAPPKYVDFRGFLGFKDTKRLKRCKSTWLPEPQPSALTLR